MELLQTSLVLRTSGGLYKTWMPNSKPEVLVSDTILVRHIQACRATDRRGDRAERRDAAHRMHTGRIIPMVGTN